MDQQQATGETEIGLSLAGLEEVHSTPPRSIWEVKAGCRSRVPQTLGHMTLLGSVGVVFQGSQTKSRLVSSNQKEQSSGKVLISGHTRGRPWKVRETVYHRGCRGSPMGNLPLLVTLWTIV